MFVYSSEFNGKPFHAVSQPIKQRCQCNFTLFTSVNSYVMTLCLRGYVLLFWAVKVWGLNFAVVLWLVMILDQCWTACHLSPLVKALESGSSGINRAFVLVVSSLCSPAEAVYKSPGGKIGRRALSWRSDARPRHTALPTCSRESCPSTIGKATARGPPMGLLRLIEWLLLYRRLRRNSTVAVLCMCILNSYTDSLTTLWYYTGGSWGQLLSFVTHTLHVIFWYKFNHNSHNLISHNTSCF